METDEDEEESAMVSLFLPSILCRAMSWVDIVNHSFMQSPAKNMGGRMKNGA